MSPLTRRVTQAGLLAPLLLLVFSGCEQARSSPKLAAAPPPEVSVATPITANVTDFLDFTGQTEAAESVDVKARVSGYLTKTLFKPGAEVKAGETLFEIDPRPYQADLDRLDGDLKGLESRLQRQTAEMTRAERLFKNKTLTAEDYEKTVGDHGETVGQIAATKASMEK
ncbi:MAG: biotin/lipoyl-binding protein, partial [Planctomycetales bacterium]